MSNGHRLRSLYDVEPRASVQAVKRNIERFPEDFMFQLSETEFEDLKSQIVTSSWGGLRRAAPYAFTKQGVAMLSSVLRSDRAIRANIEIMRTFVRLRQMLASNAELARKLATLEKKCYAQLKVVFDAIRALQGRSNAAEGREAVSGRAHDAAGAEEKAIHRLCAVGGERIPLPMTKNPRGEWETRSRATRRFRDLASAPEGAEIENAAPLDPAPPVLPAMEFSEGER